MAEHQLPKLNMRVRFPSPAPPSQTPFRGHPPGPHLPPVYGCMYGAAYALIAAAAADSSFRASRAYRSVVAMVVRVVPQVPEVVR